MESLNCTANMVIPGDVILDDSVAADRLIVLACEPKQVDGRIRFTLLLDDGQRVNRTHSPHRPLTIVPLGAARVVQESASLREALGRFLEVEG